MGLGDRRPSNILRQMKSLARNSISDEVIKSLWLHRLPTQTQAILSIKHHISVNGIQTSKERIKIIEDFKLPEAVRKWQRYLGIINFYHRIIPNAVEN
ncbi:hypothetical protein TNIN_416761 [Trichonephila inaurata madagascariensis]|uniref:Uncharacterized protein n=1 Tax=Trichonephila inaurata madagascariensis TaxID=2747483 RepID=A0A8X6WV93_9ARAC|nr:hypothetical protein TNIN_416761 [Trichonephila inaurata madagascariensis]